MTLGNLIDEEMINMTTGNPTSFMINAFFMDIIWILIFERLAFLNQLSRIPTITSAKTITTLEGIHSKEVICSFHGDEQIIKAPINPLTAGLLNIALMKFFQYVFELIIFEGSVNSIGPRLQITNVAPRSKPML